MLSSTIKFELKTQRVGSKWLRDVDNTRIISSCYEYNRLENILVVSIINNYTRYNFNQLTI